VILLINNKLL